MSAIDNVVMLGKNIRFLSIKQEGILKPLQIVHVTLFISFVHNNTEEATKARPALGH